MTHPFIPGAPVIAEFSDGAKFDRKVGSVRPDGSFQLKGGIATYRAQHSPEGWIAKPKDMNNQFVLLRPVP